MKIAVLIARILLGLIFVVFGLNPFLKYLPMQMPPGTAGQFLTVLFVSHFVYVVGAAQVIGGVLLLVKPQMLPPQMLSADTWQVSDFPTLPANFCPFSWCLRWMNVL